MDKETKKAIEQTEKTVYRIEQDTIKVSKQCKAQKLEQGDLYSPHFFSVINFPINNVF